MKILLFGKNGQVGWELQRTLAPAGKLTALDRQGGAGYCGDLTDLEELRRTVRSLKPDVIVNAAAYTSVDNAESEKDLAMLINEQAPRVMAEEALTLGSLLVHYSTDYVFDGSGTRAWVENDPVAPINQYGRSKLAGERAIQATGCKHLIFRTSWVYGAHGNNFAKTILRLAGTREQMSVINDQFGAPTGSELLSRMTAHALECTIKDAGLCGLYNLAAGGETTWYDYACFIIGQARSKGEVLAVQNILPIPSSGYPTPARRPMNSRLDSTKFQVSFAKELPHWQVGVTSMLEQIIGSGV